MIDVDKEFNYYQVIHNEILSKINLPVNFSQKKQLLKEKTDIESKINYINSIKDKQKLISENEILLLDQDLEIRQLALAEIQELQQEIKYIENKIQKNFEAQNLSNILVEIRAGTGGEEAAIFAAEFFQMYSKFAERQQWKLCIVSKSESPRNGIKEIIFSITGENAFSWFQFESGVHRVQRIPETEAQGRIHTSTCSVAIFPIHSNQQIKIEEKDLRIDTFRSSGPGGQSVNTTDSAIRITHLPSGISVQCQDEKSQLKNKTKALKILTTRIIAIQEKEEANTKSLCRKEMIKSGDRSDKIRTYNFPQDRCTDHRINISFHNLNKLFNGYLEDFLLQVKSHMLNKKN